ncbi:MAG TPA: MscL family protein [Solirubrobacteraceae bacterium]|nr:MscL family protein [Solirubrobacteraceae bacterium]
MQGFKKFLMQGNVIVAAVGLVVALAFSGLVTSFTTNIITPLVNAVGGGKNTGLGFHVHGQLVNIGAFISGIIYFVIFMAVVYYVIVVPYRNSEARRGHTVFGDPAPTKSCPECLSGDLPVAATRCLHCGVEVPAAAAA